MIKIDYEYTRLIRKSTNRWQWSLKIYPDENKDDTALYKICK